MTIHVVSAGQTLSSIAREYGVAPGLIARFNGLRAPYQLAVGQSLVILFPARTHTVRAGETLFSIASDAGLGVMELYQRNPNLGGRPEIYPGQVLVLRLTDEPSRLIETNGYAYPYVQETVLRGLLPYATYLTPFTYGFTPQGRLIVLDDERLIRLAHSYQAGALMHLSTLTEEGGFSSELATQMLRDDAARAALEDAVAMQYIARGYDGLDLDFEYVGGENAAAYASFAGQMRARINRLGGELITALAPKISATQPGVLYEGHDYAAIAANSDAVLLMTYEWGYTYGPPMAVAPLESVRRVLDYAVTEIPPEKIFMGFPNYAYDWTLPFKAGTTRARLIGNEDAVALAVRVGAEIKYDTPSATPFFNYTQDGQVHEVWFEDARSSVAKLSLVEEYGFRGVGYWNFMRPFTQHFSILSAMFRIGKFS